MAVAPGISEGKVLIHFQEEESIPFRDLQDDELDAEVARFEASLLATRIELQALQERLAESAGSGDAGIFDAHLLVLEDPTLIDEVVRVFLILEKRLQPNLISPAVLSIQRTGLFRWSARFNRVKCN